MPEEENTQEYSDEVLEETPPRVTKFLLGISGNPVIKTLLFEEGGMTDEDIEEGGELLKKCTSITKNSGSPNTDTPEAKARRKAAAQVDATDESLFARTKAALKRKYPSANNYIFQDNLKASQGLAAVHGVSLYCARVRALYEGTDKNRSKSKADDKKAIEYLSQRKITMEDIAGLEKLVAIALGQAPVSEGNTIAVAPNNTTQQDSLAERRQRLVDIKEWYDDWAETARAILKKKLHRIQVGISQRAPNRTDEASK